MKTIRQIRNLSFILLMFAAVSCSQKQGANGASQTQQAREYKVIAVKPGAVTLNKQYPATLEGQQTVEIRPRIAGYIDEILVDEGAYVNKGQVLFRLNAQDIQAQVRSAEAQVKVAEAQVRTAEINLGKTKPLVEKSIISEYDLKSSEATLESTKAQLAQAKANLENAKVNLQYTVIASPASGTIGTFPYRVGSLVSSSIAQPLTTVSNTSSMYAYFSMNERDFLQLTKNLKGDNLQKKFENLPKVSLILADKTPYSTKGNIQTASGLVDQQTGAVNIRASFPNGDGMLRNGSSGLVSIPQHLESVLLIPQKATYELQGKHFVYVVGEDNKVKNTEINVLAGNLKDQYVVTSGLQKGDQVVVEGMSTLRDDTPVKPKLVENTNSAQSSTSTNQVKN
ncbi:efflux RND transporter periplasmic adaptor subunit [Sunxiuqinia indica]|uniref:efflux RND transporter periplasmic adaptor subunit n=1 Tax=Sunxiuqinia indica TaxID=2692584 RepID=UPI001357123B|nr:efflux RND transporter periplasmic adaptor subunit [Sunxiuqinia indica]